MVNHDIKQWKEEAQLSDTNIELNVCEVAENKYV